MTQKLTENLYHPLSVQSTPTPIYSSNDNDSDSDNDNENSTSNNSNNNVYIANSLTGSIFITKHDDNTSYSAV